MHWFDTDRIFKDVSENILRDSESIFAVCGYFCQQFEYSFGENRSSTLYEDFYEKINDFWDCDRENLASAYKKYNFDKYF